MCIRDRVVFDSRVPFIHVPCNYVTSHLLTGIPELENCIGRKNALCDYLVENVKKYGENHFAWGKQIWDIGVIGYQMCIRDSFNKEVGMNMSSYINEIRVEKAKELLTHSDEKIYSIAEKIG